MNRWWQVGLWMATILVLSVGPAGSGINPFWPYAIHFLEYAILGILFFRATSYTWSLAHTSSSVFAVGASFMYGVTMETLQLLLPYRSFSIEDMVVNFTGAASGLLMLRLLGRLNQ